MDKKETQKIYIKLEDIDNVFGTFTTIVVGINTLLRYYHKKNKDDFKDMIVSLSNYCGALLIAFGIEPEDEDLI